MITLLDADFTQLNEYISTAAVSSLFFLVDENTHHYCLPKVLANLETDLPIEILEVEASEELKTVETAAHLWQILVEYQADRHALLINVGGGVVTDLGGFVASTYKRGIRFIHIPTSLLGMCDASIGGKTGVDLNFVKNIVGTFALPEQIFLNTSFLDTLDGDNLRSGFAEMLKHGLIADRAHWTVLKNLPEITPDLIAPHLYDSMNIKQKIIEQDFQEKSIRKALNFGHTIGHAVESLCLSTGHQITHGDAVAMGMICETWISEELGMLSEQHSSEVTETLLRHFPFINIDRFTFENFMQLIAHDKKNSGGHINCTLLAAIGQAQIDVKITADTIEQALTRYKNLTLS